MKLLLLGLLCAVELRAPVNVIVAWNDFVAAARLWVVAEQEFLSDREAISPVRSERVWAEGVRPAFRAVDTAVRNQ